MRYAKKTGYVLALILFLIFTAGPFVWTFILSVTPEHAMFTGDGGLLPETVIWDNYTELFSGGLLAPQDYAYTTGHYKKGVQ